MHELRVRAGPLSCLPTRLRSVRNRQKLLSSRERIALLAPSSQPCLGSAEGCYWGTARTLFRLNVVR